MTAEFDGKVPWESYHAQFELLVVILSHLTPAQKASYSYVVEALQRCFGHLQQAEVHRSHLKVRVRAVSVLSARVHCVILESTLSKAVCFFYLAGYPYERVSSTPKIFLRNKLPSDYSTYSHACVGHGDGRSIQLVVDTEPEKKTFMSEDMMDVSSMSEATQQLCDVTGQCIQERKLKVRGQEVPLTLGGDAQCERSGQQGVLIARRVRRQPRWICHNQDLDG
ncbi:hypothetical protein E2C01_026571 [Portunus trituberculatus]|uniref:Uncharacterized protein n=1 Tax=Portunus trituberculatus TaxID=210409 RepID=A0A5B7EIN8_PORTR|nr:hypothetical protein [Portunus trituberculatus]